MTNNIYFGIDVSTTNLGWSFIIDDEIKEYGVIVSDDSDWKKRVDYFIGELSELLKQYVLFSPKVLVSSAMQRTSGATSKKLLHVEGVVTAIARMSGLEWDLIGDSSWYNLIGKSTDTRRTKKERTLSHFYKWLTGSEYDGEFTWKGGLSKCSIMIGDNEIVDDIADATAVAYLYERLGQKRFKANVENEKTIQRKQMRSDNKKHRDKINTLQQKQKNLKVELKLAKESYELTQYKRDLNKIEKRKTQIQELDTKISELQDKINANEISIKENKNGR